MTKPKPKTTSDMPEEVREETVTLEPSEALADRIAKLEQRMAKLEERVLQPIGGPRR